MSVEFEELNKLRENTEDNVPESEEIFLYFKLVNIVCLVYKFECKNI